MPQGGLFLGNFCQVMCVRVVSYHVDVYNFYFDHLLQALILTRVFLSSH